MVHELFHVLQFHNGWVFSPTWLVEGSAEFVGYKGALIDSGLLSAGQAQGCHIWNIAFSSVPLGPLQNYENTIGDGPTYSLFYLAVERLLGGRGLAPLARVTNFQSSFGTSQSDFHSDFEQYRTTLQLPTSFECFGFR